MIGQKSAYRMSLRRRGAIRRQQVTRGSSAQPSVLPNSPAENPVGASYSDAAEAVPAFSSSRAPEVLPPQSTGPPIRVGASNFSEPYPTVAMGHITNNLPRFWENDVSQWFLMVENIFSMRKIDSECQRHELLLSSLDLRHLQRVEHVLLDPVFPYSYLKAALIKIFDQTEEHKLDQLLHACELGDRKPTELLAEMRKLLGTEGSPVLLKKLFMDRLPSSVRRVLVAGPIDNLDDVARRADLVFAEDRSSTSAPRLLLLQINSLWRRLIDWRSRSIYFCSNAQPRKQSPYKLILLLHPWHQPIKIVLFSALHFHVLDLAVLLTEGLVGVVFRRLLAHRWEICVFTTQGLAAMLFTAYCLVLGGALLLAAQQILMLLCQKTSSSSRLCSGGSGCYRSQSAKDGNVNCTRS